MNQPRSGLIRRLDKVGRVAIPAPIRQALNISEGSMVEFGVQGSTVTLTRYSPVCFICGDDHDVARYRIKGRGGVENDCRICASCKQQINTASPILELLNQEDL